MTSNVRTDRVNSKPFRGGGIKMYCNAWWVRLNKKEIPSNQKQQLLNNVSLLNIDKDI